MIDSQIIISPHNEQSYSTETPLKKNFQQVETKDENLQKEDTKVNSLKLK